MKNYFELQKVTKQLQKVTKSYERVTKKLRKVMKSYKKLQTSYRERFRNLILRNPGKNAFLLRSLTGWLTKTQQAQEQTLGVVKNNIYQKMAPTPRAASNAQKKQSADLGGR